LFYICIELIIKPIDMSKEMENKITVNGHTFECSNNDDDMFYECRGEVCYDDEHDEVPEDSLWDAAEELSRDLEAEGHRTSVEHSEKGWVEVQILGYKKS
jgi:hypothetical protein